MLNVSSLRDKEWYNSRQYCGYHVTADVSLVQLCQLSWTSVMEVISEQQQEEKGKSQKAMTTSFHMQRRKDFFSLLSIPPCRVQKALHIQVPLESYL